LYAIQEMWDLMSEEESVANESLSLFPDNDPAQLCLCVSKAAVSGKDSPKSMRLLGQIQGIDILMLVDSGSSNTFLSSEMAARMTGAARLAHPLSIKVANGVSMM
jgi:predicted aspartyl protease